jgi:hypothetical protein
MATENSTALNHTPETPKTVASIIRKLEQNLMKLGYMDFASEAKMNRLIAGFLRTNGYRVGAKRFAESAKFAALSAKAL